MRVGRIAVASLFLATPVFAQGPVPVGREITVAPEAGFSLLHHPAVAADGLGRFVVVWSNQDGYEIFGRRYDAGGRPMAAEFQISTYTTGSHRQPRVASDPTGTFVVVWKAFDEEGWGIFARRYASDGGSGPAFRVSAPPDMLHGPHAPFPDISLLLGLNPPAVAMDDAGGFIVVWSDGNFGGNVRARRYDASAAPRGPEFIVNSYTGESTNNPSVDMDAAGNFVVAWTADTGDPPLYLQVRARRYDSSGSPVDAGINVTPPFARLTMDLVPVKPSVAMTPGAGFVVAWPEYVGQAYFEVFAQRYDGTGNPLGGRLQVNSTTTWSQNEPVVSSDAGGNFVVAWKSDFPDGHSYGVFAQAYDATGAPVGAEFQVNTYTRGDQYWVSIAPGQAGHFVVSWSGGYQAGYSAEWVSAQRFGPDLIFGDGVEGGDLSAWSAASSDGGDLVVSGSAAMGSTVLGLEGTLDDTAGLYVEDASPAGEKHYRARFYLDPNGFDPGEAQGHNRIRTLLVFSESPNRRVAAVVLRRLGGQYGIMGRAREDDNSQEDTDFVPIDDGPHAIEVDLLPASAPDAFDGTFELWIDGVSVGSRTALDNYLAQVDFVRMGALSVKSGASGTIYWDEFESRRASYIGLLP